MRLGLTLAVALMTAGAAAAGPTWDYSITFGPAVGADAAFAGVVWEEDLSQIDPLTGLPPVREYAVLQSNTLNPSGYQGTATGSMIPRSNDGLGTNWYPVANGHTLSLLPLDQLPGIDYSSEWSVRYAITELASGESGSVELRMKPRASGQLIPYLWASVYWDDYRAVGPASVDLGGWRFTPNFLPRWGEESNELNAGVDATRVAASVPEPASFALAALGLGAVAARRRRAKLAV